jgi:hypothetical protein
LTDAVKSAAVTLTERSRHGGPPPASGNAQPAADPAAGHHQRRGGLRRRRHRPNRHHLAPHLGHLSRGETANLFNYSRRRPLAITRLGLTTRLSAQEVRGVTVEAITYASPKGGEVPALLVVPKRRGPFPGVIVQHGLPSTKEDFLPVGIDLARTGA